MRVLIVTQYFWPEPFRINDLAWGLADRGHQITVLTGCPNYPEGQFYPGFGLFNRKTIRQGVEIIRVPLLPRGSSSGLRLLLNYASFAFCASLLGPLLCRGKFDSIFVCQLSPVTVAIPGMVMKFIKKAPLAMWILDLWPESLAAAGGVRSPWVLSLVERLVRFIYKRCDRILYSSLGFRASLGSKGVKFGEMDYFPNWVDPEADIAPPLPVELPKGFLVMFAGNIGVAQDFETILSAAERLRELPDLHWVILGDGRRLDWVREQVNQRSLGSCFHLLGRHPAESMPSFFLAADVMLVTLKPEPVFALTVPGKLQAYLACGKPVLAALDGEGAELIRAADAGMAVPAGDAVSLSRALHALYELSTEERTVMGARGKEFSKLHFCKDAQFTRMERILFDLADSKKSLE